MIFGLKLSHFTNQKSFHIKYFWLIRKSNLSYNPISFLKFKKIPHCNVHENFLHCRLSLKKRLFIGNTSMDPQLSLLMANLTKVDRTHLVFDPFVGTGKAFKDFKVAPNIDFLMVSYSYQTVSNF